MLTSIRGLLQRRPRRGVTGASASGDSSRSLYLPTVPGPLDAGAVSNFGDSSSNYIVPEPGIHPEAGSAGERLTASVHEQSHASRRRSLDLEFDRRRSFGHVRAPIRERTQRAVKNAVKAADKSTPASKSVAKDHGDPRHTVAKYPSEPPAAQKLDRKGTIFISRRRKAMRTALAVRDAALPNKSSNSPDPTLVFVSDTANAADVMSSQKLSGSNAATVLGSGEVVEAQTSEFAHHALRDTVYTSHDTVQPQIAPKASVETAEKDHSEVGIQRSTDEEGFSSPSTHISRDPFLNDSASIPESSTSDLTVVPFHDDRTRRRQPVDFFFDLENDLLAQNRSKRKDRERLRDRGLENGPARLRWPGDRRQPKPFLKSSGSVHTTVSSDVGDSSSSQAGAGLHKSDYVSSSNPSHAGGPRVVSDSKKSKGNASTLFDDDATTFQPMSSSMEGLEGLDKSENFKNTGSHVSLMPSSSDARPTTSSRTSSSMRRRSAVWKLRSTDHESRSHSEQERSALKLMSMSEAAVKERNPDAAEHVVGIVDTQIATLDSATLAVRAQISQSRALFASLPSCRGQEYNNLLYSNVGASEAEEAASARIEAELVYREFNLMEGVWDIEAAVVEQQWREAVELVELLRIEDAAIAKMSLKDTASTLSGAVLSGTVPSAVDNRSGGVVGISKEILADKQTRTDRIGADTNSKELDDRFVNARAALTAVVDRLATELRARVGESASVEDVRRYAPLLARLGFVEEARRLILVNSEAGLLRQLNRARDACSSKTKQNRFVAFVASRLFAQTCDTFKTFHVIGSVDSASSSQFLCWAVHQADTAYNVYLAPHVSNQKYDVFELSSLIKSLRRATAQVGADTIVKEIGMLFNSRLASHMRQAISTALMQYKDGFARRAEVAGSSSLETWQAVPLKSSLGICEELEKFTRNAALNLLGIDNSLDALIASVLTVACGTYAANLLDSADAAISSGWSKQQSINISTTLKGTLSSLGEALIDAASVDHTLRSNAGISWMNTQLKNGGLCGADGLRTMSQSSVPPRPRPGLIAPVRNLSVSQEKQQQQQSAPPRESESLSDVSARDAVREMLNHERFIVCTAQLSSTVDKRVVIESAQALDGVA